jgi:DNA repair exonuclease SbcCD ATPase subunit
MNEILQALETQVKEANKVAANIDSQVVVKKKRLKKLRSMIKKVTDNYKTIIGPETSVISLNEFRKIKDELTRAGAELDKSLNELQKTIATHMVTLNMVKKLETQIEELKGEECNPAKSKLELLKTRTS